MMTFEEVVLALEALEAKDLRRWIEASWVKPLREGEGFHFGDMDYARVRFIYDMHYELNVNAEAMPILLGLLDQVYELRRQMIAMGRAIEAQPEAVKSAIARVLLER